MALWGKKSITNLVSLSLLCPDERLGDGWLAALHCNRGLWWWSHQAAGRLGGCTSQPGDPAPGSTSWQRPLADVRAPSRVTPAAPPASFSIASCGPWLGKLGAFGLPNQLGGKSRTDHMARDHWLYPYAREQGQMQSGALAIMEKICCLKNNVLNNQASQSEEFCFCDCINQEAIHLPVKSTLVEEKQRRSPGFEETRTRR